MKYFDTDVLVNFFVRQAKAPHLHEIARNVVQEVTDAGLFLVSTHSLNELVFALAKCGTNRDEILKNVAILYTSEPVSVTLDQFKRATEIAYQVSFHHGSDCLHTAIAETYCDELYTFNRSDFQLIQHHTRLKITIL